MTSIPVIGTAIVNGVHWLQRLIASIDYPVDNFVIFNNNGRGELTSQLDSLIKPHPYIKHIHVCHLPTNLGCPAAWNLIIKSYMMSPYWIILNHDVAFTSGFLEDMYIYACNPDIGMVHGASGEFGVGTWDIFLIKDWVVQKYGLFDENLYPAYCEDWDYLLRFISEPINKAFITKPYYHGETLEYAKSGSQTWREDTSLKAKLDYARQVNESYYLTNKWGDNWWQFTPSNRYPYNNPQNDLGYNKYDLNLIRHKYIGF
jgi:hypothetical protein